MNKHILVLSYSQSGQLSRLRNSFVRGLCADGICVETVEIEPEQPYPFPWPFLRFFDTFPETVHLRPAPIKTPVLQRDHYDLVVLAYTVWFLSPAPPVVAFLQSAQGRAVLHGTPVLTLIGCRNMWLMAQEKMKALLSSAGAHLVGNVVKTDRCGTAASFITTPLWMLTGKRKAASWLPEAGIAESDIADAERFGRRTAEKLSEGGTPDGSLLRGMGAVQVNERLIPSERFAHRSFYLWGALIMAAGRKSILLRRTIVCFYIVFLIALILTVVPAAALIKRLAAPLLRDRIRAQKDYFAQPSGE